MARSTFFFSAIFLLVLRAVLPVLAVEDCDYPHKACPGLADPPKTLPPFKLQLPVPEDRLIARGSLLVFKVKLGSGVEKFIGCIDGDGRVVHPESDLKVCGSASTHAIYKTTRGPVLLSYGRPQRLCGIMSTKFACDKDMRRRGGLRDDPLAAYDIDVDPIAFLPNEDYSRSRSLSFGGLMGWIMDGIPTKTVSSSLQPYMPIPGVKTRPEYEIYWFPYKEEK